MADHEQLRIADLEDRRRWGRGAYELVGYEPRKGHRVHDWGWVECCTSLGSTWDGTVEFAVDYRSVHGQPRRVICRGSAHTRLQPSGEDSPTT